MTVSAPTTRASPTFLGALRGIWLFTWKPQLGWKRIPLLALGLLALPVLVFLTTPPPGAWTERHSALGPPDIAVAEFARRIALAGFPLQPGQRERLRAIFADEFAHAAAASSELQSPEESVARQKEEIRLCYGRIQSRAREVLDEQQQPHFQTFKNRIVPLAQARVRASWSRPEPFYHWLVDFYFFVILPLQCVKGSGGLIRDELQADTLGFLLTRPLSRARLLTVKWLAQTAWLQATLLLETLLLFAVGGLRHIPGLPALLPLLIAAQLLAVFAWSALGTLLGQVSKRYLAIALVYGLIVEMGIGRIPTNINTLSLMRHLKTLLAHHSGIQGLYQWNGTGAFLSICALLLAAGLFLALSAALFTFREYYQTAEMQK